MPRAPKPEWLRKKITPSAHKEMITLLGEGDIHTICQEAMCPNISECFGQRVATFMILGVHCTRACSFCAVSRAKPMPPNPLEPENIAQAVSKLGLKHVVITAPTRDDLSDGGAEHFSQTVRSIKALDSSIVVEILISDLQENDSALKQIAMSGAEIIGHNIETVPRLYHVRKGADYNRSLRVLQKLLASNPTCATKSAIMLGLGEKKEEVLQAMEDLLGVGCRYLSIGQYLSPSLKHTSVVEYVEPKRFEFFAKKGLEMGFKHIKSSPYTRSSYMAHEYLERR
jgi:lipoic acid synthetase